MPVYIILDESVAVAAIGDLALLAEENDGLRIIDLTTRPGLLKSAPTV